MNKVIILAALVVTLGLVCGEFNTASAQCGTIVVGGGYYGGGFYGGGFYGGCYPAYVAPCYPVYRPCYPVYRPLGCGGYWSGGIFIRF